MNILVLFDSMYGNTELVARKIAEALDMPESVRLLKAGEAGLDDLQGVDLLIVGSATQAFRPLPGMTGFLNRIPAGGLKGVRVAAFDTRVDVKEVNSGFLTFMVNLFGYAAEKIAKSLQKKGGEPALPVEGFFVVDKEGPLKEGELERAAGWIKGLL